MLVLISGDESGDESHHIFPNMSGSVWMWSHDGKYPRGLMEFLPDGQIKRRYGKRGGAWYLQSDGMLVVKFTADVLATKHILRFDNRTQKAYLEEPSRRPQSQLWWLKGTWLSKIRAVGKMKKPKNLLGLIMILLR